MELELTVTCLNKSNDFPMRINFKQKLEAGATRLSKIPVLIIFAYFPFKIDFMLHISRNNITKGDGLRSHMLTLYHIALVTYCVAVTIHTAVGISQQGIRETLLQQVHGEIGRL